MEKYDLNRFDYHLLRSLSLSQEKNLAGQIRDKIIDVVSHNGGHLSSNLGVVELTIALLRSFDPLRDDLIFDVGHQTYAYKILTGRDITDIRKAGGPSGFQDFEESPADKLMAGHSSTSISVAMGISAAKKLSGRTDSYTVVIIGDAAIANGLAFEALNTLDDRRYGKLIIILNDNNMSISRPEGALSHLFNRIRTSTVYQEEAGRFKKTFSHRGLSWIYKAGVGCKELVRRIFIGYNYFDSFNCAYLGPIDGHNLNKVERFLERAKKIDRSVILHVRTKKGKGYKPAEDDESGYWHGASAFDPDTGQPLNSHPQLVSLSHLAGDAIAERLKSDRLACVITPAMKKGSHLEEAFRLFPDRCFDVGIAEDHAVDLAAGLALGGRHPILSIYSTFMQRGYDQLVHDLCRMKLPVLIVVDRAGLVGADGSSHQGIFDVDMLLGMPNSSIYNPYSGSLLKKLICGYDFSFPGPTVVRAERDYVLREGNSLAPGAGQDYLFSRQGGSRRCLICMGIEGVEAFSRTRGHANVVLLNKIKPFPKDLLAFLLTQQEITVYDSTSTAVGFGSYLSLLLSEGGYRGRLEIDSLPNSFIRHGSKLDQLKALGLDVDRFVGRYLSRAGSDSAGASKEHGTDGSADSNS